MAHPARAAKTFGHPVPINLMPATFGADYVENVVAPYILSNRYTGDQPVLPMIDLVFGKAGSTMAHIWGLLYDGWQDAGEEEGLTVFLQDYANRGRPDVRSAAGPVDGWAGHLNRPLSLSAAERAAHR